MKTLRSLALGALVLAGTLAGAAPGDTAYLFTYFTGNGEDGLHLAWSADFHRADSTAVRSRADALAHELEDQRAHISNVTTRVELSCMYDFSATILLV